MALLTLSELPPRAKSLHVGGVVIARSVKFLGSLRANKSDTETRDSWWIEIRDELRSHARSLDCSHVMGYSERCSIYDDVCVLSCTLS